MDKLQKLDGKSFDIVEDNIKKLQELFPEIVTEGKVDIDKLALLFDKARNEDTEGKLDGEERYEFTWKGKKEAMRIAQKQSTGTLRPYRDEKESLNFDKTKNLYIEGDNLEVLRALQSSYRGKVKMIYIDPPYNTGNDFIYKDDFKDNIDNYKEKMNEAYKTNTNNDGRYHTNWLNMMYPRLKLGKNLLHEEGVIFISIGQNELDNLIKVCDEVFGEENRLGIVSRQMKSGGGSQGKYFAHNIDYIIVYAKFYDTARYFKGEISEDLIKKVYNQVEKEGIRKGEYYRSMGLYQSSLGIRPNLRYWIECPDGSLVIPKGESLPKNEKEGEKANPVYSDGVWRWSYEKYLDEKLKNNIEFKKTNNKILINEKGEASQWNVYTKIWLKDRQNEGQIPGDLITKFENRHSSKELNCLNIPFDFAKPIELIRYLIYILQQDKDAIIMDFFSGSATTAHAVMQLNAEDGGERKFIMVQIPEETDKKSEAFKAGYKNICEIGKERIRRAGKKILEENKDKEGIEDLDIGFKVFKLDSTNLKAWDENLKSDKDMVQQLEDLQNPIKADRTMEDLVYEIMLKYGVDLTMPIEELNVLGSKVYSVGYGYLMICLEDNISLDLIEAIGNEKPNRVVLADKGLTTSDLINGEKILKELGVEDIRTI